MNIEINITPMSFRNGVLGLPIDCCRDWSVLSGGVEGIFIYAGRTSNVTYTPKHINLLEDKAAAWQFTVNDLVQFNQLRLDGVHTYIDEKVSGEKLICELEQIGDKYKLEVLDVKTLPATNATKKVKALLKQGFRPEASSDSPAPVWNAPSGWIPYNQLDEYSDVRDCLYIWQGKKGGFETVYLYVGIVGNSRGEGMSKRNLAQRLKEEEKKFSADYVHIEQFRFCSLNNPHGYSVPELLKTVEMAEITVMTSLFKCESARENIDALFGDQDVVLLNRMTSYKFVK